MESAIGMNVGSISALPLSSSVTMATLLQFSESQLPSLRSNNASLAGSMGWRIGSGSTESLEQDAHA